MGVEVLEVRGLFSGLRFWMGVVFCVHSSLRVDVF